MNPIHQLRKDFFYVHRNLGVNTVLAAKGKHSFIVSNPYPYSNRRARVGIDRSENEIYDYQGVPYTTLLVMHSEIIDELKEI